MEAKAVLKHLRMSPRKARIVADAIRGRFLADAFHILNFSNKRACVPIKKLLNSAIENARQKGEIDIDRVYVKNIFVDKGVIMKRYLPRAMGRATRINKKTSHITIIIDEY